MRGIDEYSAYRCTTMTHTSKQSSLLRHNSLRPKSPRRAEPIRPGLRARSLPSHILTRSKLRSKSTGAIIRATTTQQPVASQIGSRAEIEQRSPGPASGSSLLTSPCSL